MPFLYQNCFQIARYYQKFCLQNVYFHFLKSFLEKFKQFLNYIIIWLLNFPTSNRRIQLIIVTFVKNDFMKKFSAVLVWIKGNLNKYWIAVLFFVVITFVIGDSAIDKRISYNNQIKQLEQEIEFFTLQKDENEQKLSDLHSDNESLERLAREQYQMLKEDEELFIIK